jgi:hypothetical protein
MFAVNTWSDYRATLTDGWEATDRKAFVLKEQTERAFEAGRLVAARIEDTAAIRGLGYFRGEGWLEAVSARDAGRRLADAFRAQRCG